jgi:hypothetical protein
MDSHEEMKYLALIRFDEAFLQPSLIRGRKVSSELRLYHLAEWLECYFWLALGISLDVFPGDGARALVRRRLESVFPEFQGFLESWGYLFDSRLTNLVTIALNHKKYFVKMNFRDFEDPDFLCSSFQSACLLETRFALDSDGRGLVTALNSRHGEFMQCIEDATMEKSHQPFVRPENSLEIANGSIVRGFLKMVDHLTNFGFLFEHLKLKRSVGLTDQELFERRLRQLAGWRFNFGRGRAYQILLGMLGNIEKYLPSEVGRRLEGDTLKSEVRRLLGEWSAERTAALDA